MSQYVTSELYNELSKVFRARLDPGRDGGTLNTQQEYEQLVEMVATTLLLHNDSIFYIGYLSRNRLFSLVRQEADLIEDMLVLLDDLSQIGSPVLDTATLNNAKTALLALDSAETVLGRPELDRFIALMDSFANQHRPNVISTSNSFVRPRENARNILLEDMARLQRVHERMLSYLSSLKDLASNYADLDIPSRVSATVMASIRETIDGLIEDIESDSSTENIAKSRDALLTTLTGKTAVQLLANYTDPSEVKIRSPHHPVPSTMEHWGRVSGDGDPAFVTTGPGPWVLPFTDPLDISLNGAAAVSVPVDAAVGGVLNGRNSELFEISADTENLHVVVDPNLYKGAVNEPLSSGSSATLDDYLDIGFRHLGCPVWFSAMDGTATAPSGQPNPDFYARVITEMRHLQDATVGSVTSYGPETREVTFTVFGAGDEGGTGLGQRHVGGYIKQGAIRYEVLEVHSSTVAILSVPPGFLDPSPGASELRGQTTTAGGTKFDFLPIMDAANGDSADGECTVGAAVKTVKLTTGINRTASQVVIDVENEAGNFSAMGPPEEALNRHAKVSTVAGDPAKVSIAPRTRVGSYLAVATGFPQVQSGAPLVYVENSAHVILGFNEGEQPDGAGFTPTLTPGELANLVKEYIPASTTEVVETELYVGAGLSTALGSSDASDAAVDFEAVASVGDNLEILSGLYAGIYQITNISGSTLTLRDVTFQSAESGLPYQVIQLRTKISSTPGPGSSLQVVSSPSELELTAEIQYGLNPRFEAVDKFGNQYPFSEVYAQDLLTLVGGPRSVEITGVEDGVLQLATGLPSNKLRVGFEIQGGASKRFEDMKTNLTTVTDSTNLLKKYGFDENLDDLDVALTIAILPSQNFVSNQNLAKAMLSHLLSILTSSLSRSDEYSTTIPESAITIEDTLQSYQVRRVDAVERILSALQERKYERAAKLLREGKLQDFFDTTEQTGSFGGAVMDAARSVSSDLPEPPSAAHVVLDQYNQSSQSREVADADTVFDDYDPSLESEE